MLLVKVAMTEASKQTTLPKRMQLRNVLIGQSLVTAPLELPMDQQRWEIIALVIIFLLTGLGRKQDQRVETATAFPAVPNVTGALIAPVLRPFGGDQVITALNAFHSEAGTTIGNSHPHGSLHAFAFT